MRKISLISFLLATTALAIFTSATIRKIDTIQSNTATDITIDPSGDLILTSATANTVPYFNATKKLLSSVVTDTELAYLSGVTSAIQTQLDSKAADADVVKITGDQSISGVKTFTGQIVASTTSNGNRPCPTMTEAQRDAISSPVLGDCITNSDTSSLNIYDGTAWGAVGGGGQGGINYIEQYNAESSITDWVTYADVAGVNAVDGTGGTANITWTKNSSSPLIEANDFKLTKDAADRQGEGVAVPFTIDSGYQSNKIYISFKYDASSASYDDDDIRIQVYDVTNSRLIRVNGEDLKGTTKGNYLGWFQSSADSTSYRLIFHISSTNASAYDVYFDNVQVGPREVSYGSAITDWQPYTPTFTGFGTVTNINIEYRRVGSNLEIRGRYLTGTTTATEARISLPNNLVSSDTLTPTLQKVGDITFGNASASVGYLLAEPTQSYLTYSLQSSSNAGLTKLNGTSLASNNTHSIEARVPIKGWSSNSIQSEDIGNREIRVRGAGNGGGLINALVDNIDFTEVEDTTNSWNGTTFTAPETGDYEINGIINISPASSTWGIFSYINGVLYKLIGYVASSSVYVPISGTVNLIKGDTLTFRSNNTITLFNDAAGHHIHIQKLAQPQTILETETVAARYTSNSGQSVGATETIEFEDIDFDTHSAYNTSTGVYTVPVTGKYQVNCSYRMTTSIAANLAIQVDGVTKTLSTSDNANQAHPTASDIYSLSKNQQVTCQKSGGASGALDTVSVNNFFSISRLK